MILKRSRFRVFLMVGLTLLCAVLISLASSTLAPAQGMTLLDQTAGGNGDSNGQASSSQYQYGQDDIDITNIINIPGKDLPKTGGLPLLGILFAVVVGTGLLTAVVRRRR